MSSPSSDHKTVVRREFTQQAQAYAANPSIVDHGRLARLVQAVHPKPQASVLDVATGPGYVAMTFAEVGCEVLGIDLTEAPLAIAEQMRQARGLMNLRFQVGDAERLSFGSRLLILLSLALRCITVKTHDECSRKWRACAAYTGWW
jgi:ubiquinone/menaquinone biosynthesis C-methylase UbiE